jgi:small subunit ribosomal protein S17
MSESTQTAKADEQAQATGQAPADTRGNRRKLRGRVINDTESEGRARKTVIVRVDRRFKNPMYGKYVKTRKAYHAHDEHEKFKKGDLVEIRESRPMSATKRWVVVRLIERPEEV